MVGTDQSVEAPPGVSDLTCAVPPGRRRPGDDPRGVSRASRSAPDRVAASSVRRSLLVVFTTARSSAIRPSDRSEDRPAAPTGFAAPSGFWRGCRLRPCPVGSPLLGFHAPLATSAEEIRITRVCLTRHRPSSGFLTPSTGCSLLGLADSLGPLPPLGFSLAKSFRTGRPGRVAASAALLRPRCFSASNSEEFEVASSAGSEALEPARPGSMAMVPGLPRAPSEHIIPGPSSGLSPRLVPSHAPALGGWVNHTASSRRPRVFGRSGNQRIYERPAAPMGFLLLRKTLRRLPLLSPTSTGIPVRSRKFSGTLAPSRAPPGLPGGTPFHVIGLSKSFLRGQPSRRSRLTQIGRAHV